MARQTNRRIASLQIRHKDGLTEVHLLLHSKLALATLVIFLVLISPKLGPALQTALALLK